MTAAKRIEKAFDDDANLVISNTIEPGPATLDQLIWIIDDRELYDAIVEILKGEARDPTLAPS